MGSEERVLRVTSPRPWDVVPFSYANYVNNVHWILLTFWAHMS